MFDDRIEQIKNDFRIGPELLRKGKDVEFTEVEDQLVRIYGWLDSLRSPAAEWLPPGIQPTISNLLDSLAQYLAQMRDFAITGGGDPVQQKQSIINGLRSTYEQLYPHVLPVFALHAAQELESEGAKERAASLTAAANQAKERLAEIERTLQAARTAAGREGTAQFAGVFEAEANAHKRAAERWLMATVSSIAGFVGIAAALLALPLILWPKESLQDATQLAIAKIAVLTIAFFAVYQCSRLYRANRHMEVTARHRMNSLQTFQALKESTDDPATQNAVLLEATRAIFGIGETGFVVGDGQDVGTFAALVEAITRRG